MEASLRGASGFNDRSDYSVALMYLGRNDEAVELLQQLEKEKPGQYFIAANLGTAYELSWQNEEALRWINEGIRRNPNSHESTEWLHARILEAKIAQQKNPDHFKKHSVLELDPDAIGKVITIGQVKLSAEELVDTIEYQLAERLEFVKPPDPAVASLLFDYAAIEARTVTLESAEKILQMAVEYGYPTEKVVPLLKLYDQRIAWRKAKPYLIGVVILSAVALLLRSLYKRGIFVLSGKGLRRN